MVIGKLIDNCCYFNFNYKMNKGEKVRAKVVFKNYIKSPSPDKHTSNKIVFTNPPPLSEITKFREKQDKKINREEYIKEL